MQKKNYFPVFLQTALPGNLLSGLLQNKEPIKLLNGYSRCPFCPREMKKKDNMIKHIRIHTGEKPHQCCFCSYACSDKSSLIRHSRSCPNRPVTGPAHGSALGLGQIQEPPMVLDPMTCVKVEDSETSNTNTPLAALYTMQSDQS